MIEITTVDHYEEIKFRLSNMAIPKSNDRMFIHWLEMMDAVERYEQSIKEKEYEQVINV